MPEPLTPQSILRPGITGARTTDRSPWEARWTATCAAFKTACHALARELRTKPAFTDVRVARSYVSMSFAGRVHEPFSLLLHLVHPYVAAVADPEPWPLEFLDVEPAAGHVSEPLVLLPRKVLEERLPGPLPKTVAAGLSPSDLYDIKYWNPTRVGDAIFNNFD